MRNRDVLPHILLISLTLAAPVRLLAQTAQPKAQKPQAKPQAKPPNKPQPAQAEENNPYIQRFKQLDRNADGYVTVPEWPLEESSFHQVDRDQDGRLSRNELLTPNVLRRDDRFRQLDSNGDGRLNPTERRRGGTALDGLDRNKDGYVTPLEYRDGAGDIWNPRAGTVQVQRRFQNLDRNRDNRLTRPEWTGAGPSFDRLDRNRDGVISPNEWQGP
jgi:Ca2+-binding EF-hand superfamily protein